MATDDQQQQDDDQPQDDGQDRPEGDPLGRIKALEAENARLKAAREEKSRESEKHRKQLQEMKRAQAGQPTPEELQRERDEAIRELDAERAGRRDDKIAAQIERAAVKADVPKELVDLVPGIVRGMFEPDEDGTIPDFAPLIAQLQKERPQFAPPKKPDGGTGQPRPPGGGNRQQAVDPVANFLNRKTSLGT